MQHERHYSLEEANATLPWVREAIERLRAARDRLGDREAREALKEAGPTNGGGDPARTVGEGFMGVRTELMEFRDRDIVLRDLDRGLVDFPSLREGREVYLCWEEGEDTVGYWHDLEAGFGGRQPVNDG